MTVELFHDQSQRKYGTGPGSNSIKLCKHLGIDSSTDLDDRYSNLFLYAYINRHEHTEYLKMVEVYSPLGIWHVFLYSINTNIYHFRSMKYRQYA